MKDAEGDISNYFGFEVLAGNMEYKRLPWEPEKGEGYRYLNPDGVIQGYSNKKDTIDMIFTLMNNRFRDTVEAESRKDEIMTLYKKIDEGKVKLVVEE